jgi:hypothetical protein
MGQFGPVRRVALADVGRALGRGLARGFRFGRDAALVAQT